MNKISINKSWAQSWRIFKKNWLALIYALAVPLAIGLIINSIFKVDEISKKPITLAIFCSLAVYYIIKYIIDTWLMIGRIKINIDSVDHKKPKFKDLFNPQGVYSRFLMTSILFDLCLLGGLILLVIPGIYIALTYYFAPTLVLDKNMKIGEAFTKAKAMTKGKKMQILWFLIVDAFYGILGFIALGIGVVITGTVSQLAIFHLYRQLSGEVASE